MTEAVVHHLLVYNWRQAPETTAMCRNIKTLFNFDPPATDEEIRAASLQFVRKISGTTTPSKVNAAAFDLAVGEVSLVVRDLLGSLSTSAPTKNREIEAAKARERSARRFERTGPSSATAQDDESGAQVPGQNTNEPVATLR
jgi:hypothetical protein